MNPLHRWDLRPDEAIKTQAELRERVSLVWDGRTVNLIAGVDCGFDTFAGYEQVAHDVVGIE